MTSRELAALAGVSQSTVSRVLNHCGNVSERKRKKVLEMAEIYHFELDENARSLKTQKVNKVGVVLSSYFVGFDQNLFWANIYSQLHAELQKRGLTAIPVYGYEESAGVVLNRLIRQRQVDHIILVATDRYYEEQHLRILFEKNIPFVCIYDRAENDQYYERRDVNILALDFRKAGELAAEFLYHQGHRKIALHLNEKDQSSQSRCEGFQRRMGNDCEIWELSPANGMKGLTFQGGYAAVKENMHVFQKCSAVLAVNDAAAIGMISALQEEGIRVPDDISVIGINDIPMCQWWRPHLTTVAFDVEQIMKHTSNLLLSHSNAGLQEIIEPRLVIRNSVRQK